MKRKIKRPKIGTVKDFEKYILDIMKEHNVDKVEVTSINYCGILLWSVHPITGDAKHHIEYIIKSKKKVNWR